jgi:hypothetical protein
MSRMTANVVIDAVVGSVPIAGDAFDVYWKSNQRNVDLLQRHVASGGTDSAQARRSDIVFFVFASVAVLTAITLSLWLAFWAMTLLSRPFR